MEYFDIILLAAITTFLLGRLWIILGRKDEGDEDDFASSLEKDDTTREEETVFLPKKMPTKQQPQEITPFGHAAMSLAGVIDQIKIKEPQFDEKHFLHGAKAAFFLIVDAFRKGELSSVEHILSPQVKEVFQKAIESRRKEGLSFEGKVERIIDAEILSAKIMDDQAFITVSFTSVQESIVRDSEGRVIEGAPGKTETVNDKWTFSRKLGSEDPNWILVETKT